ICPSQMAEGLAAEYGADVLVAESAGLVTAGVVVEETVRSVTQKNIDISGQYTKPLRVDATREYDLIVSVSGFSLPDAVRAPTVAWVVPDPIGQSSQVYAQLRDQIEALVLRLISDFRQNARKRS